MKHNDKVYLLVDGKLTRSIPGKVLRGQKGYKILVRFKDNNNDIKEYWFKKDNKCKWNRNTFTGYVYEDIKYGAFEQEWIRIVSEKYVKNVIKNGCMSNYFEENDL